MRRLELAILSFACLVPQLASSTLPKLSVSVKQAGSPGASQSKSDSPAPKPAEKILPDSGSVSESTYTNDFFGFTYLFPKGWSVQGEVTRRYVMDLGKAIVSGGEADRKAMLDVAEKRTYQLLMVFEHPFGSPVPFNPGIIVMSEDVSFAPGVQTGKDYNLNVKMVVQRRHPDLKVLREPLECSFGGKPFSRMDITYEASSDKSIYQSIVSTIIERNVLSFIFTGEKPERLEQLVPTLNTLEFKTLSQVTGRSSGTATTAGDATAGASSSIELITPTNGVNFDSYIKQLLIKLKQKWYSGMPEEAREGQKGKAVVQFQIQADGGIESATLETSSGNDILDDAAMGAIRRSDPLDPLPPEFHGPFVRLRIIFLYNLSSKAGKP
jgi:TonB family protein